MNDMTHEEIVNRCIELDKNPHQIVYLLERDPRTFKLIWAGHYWGNVPYVAKYCIVEQNSIFFTQEEATAAIHRVIGVR